MSGRIDRRRRAVMRTARPERVPSAPAAEGRCLMSASQPQGAALRRPVEPDPVPPDPVVSLDPRSLSQCFDQRLRFGALARTDMSRTSAVLARSGSALRVLRTDWLDAQ